jgi:hypothetical protein
MKSLAILTILLTAAPALAITFNGGTVNSAAAVTIGNVVVADADTAAAGMPDALAAASNALQANSGGGLVQVFNSVNANWASAAQGTVALSWGWVAMDSRDTQVDTRNAPNQNWAYSFTTGASAATFTANWTLDVASADSFGLQGVYSFDGVSPFNITPFNVSPTGDTGSYSFALAPNTSYTLSLTNFGNFGPGTLNSVGAVGFNMDWTILEDRMPGIPEPASWAMLIVGFGLVGAGQRRQSRRHALA